MKLSVYENFLGLIFYFDLLIFVKIYRGYWSYLLASIWYGTSASSIYYENNYGRVG